METQCQVFTTAVDFEGETYTASYYVEHNVINANISGRLMSTALTSVPAETTVQALLRGYLMQTQRKTQPMNKWVGG